MVLFVCHSNAGLSPMAEAIFRYLEPQILVQSAGLRSTHVRPLVKRVLEEERIDAFGLFSKDLFGVDLSEVQFAVGLCLPHEAPRLPSRIQTRWWGIPDPLCAPPEEQLEDFRALRDELLRRIPKLVSEIS